MLEALAPAAVELSLSAADDLKREGDRLDRQWRLQLERAEYQTALARRRYEAAEPENRLVARELERQWEEAMRAEQRLREEHTRVRPRPIGDLTATDRARIAAVAADIPGLWASAGAADRQAIVRHLVARVEVAATATSEVARLTVRWVGGDISRHEVIRPVGQYGQLERLPQLLARIRELMGTGTRSGEIAARLNAEGFRSPRGDQRFTADRIRQIVGRFGLRPQRCRETGAIRLRRHEVWMTDLAEELDIPIPTLMAWCRRGWVEARKVETHELRWVVWADATEKKRMQRLAGGRSSGLTYPYPVELITPKRIRQKARLGE